MPFRPRENLPTRAQLDALIPFEEAIKSNAVKEILPTTLSSENLRKLSNDIKRSAFFSAKVENAAILQKAKDAIDAILDPIQTTRVLESGGPPVIEGLDRAKARLDLGDFIRKEGYEAPEGKEGTIEDLSSEQRLNLIIDTQTQSAYGYGYREQGNDPDILDVWPAQELYRAEGRKVPREWALRWAAAAQESGDDKAMAAFADSGKMAALKDSGIWQAIADGAGGYDDTLGNPWAPFAFNSGMDLRDIDRNEALDLGLLEQGQTVEPDDVGFLDNAEAGTSKMSPELRSALAETLGDEFKLEGDTLKYSG